MQCSNTGLLAVQQLDTKAVDVVFVGNCHKPDVEMIERKNNEESKGKMEKGPKVKNTTPKNVNCVLKITTKIRNFF